MMHVYASEKMEYLVVFPRCLFASDAPTSLIAVGDPLGLAGGTDGQNDPEG